MNSFTYFIAGISTVIIVAAGVAISECIKNRNTQLRREDMLVKNKLCKNCKYCKHQYHLFDNISCCSLNKSSVAVIDGVPYPIYCPCDEVFGTKYCKWSN